MHVFSFRNRNFLKIENYYKIFKSNCEICWRSLVMGEFTKQTLTTFAEFECNRQLFINLAKDDSQFIHPFREIIPLERPRIGLKLLSELGRKYEQMTVYQRLIKISGVNFTPASAGTSKIVHNTSLNPSLLESYYQECIFNNTTSLCLLEHEFIMPDSFLKHIFAKDPQYISPNLSTSSFLRPDILILQKSEESSFIEVKELLPDGKIHKLSSEELGSRVSINIIDIKVSNPDSVGKKHFFEILFYASALSHYIFQHNLQDKFFVNIKDNGILPNIPNFFITEITDLFTQIVSINWEDTYLLFSSSIDVVQEILQVLPKDLDQYLDVKIQPACGRCNYLDDCKASLGMKNPDSGEWDVRLLPYVSRSIAEQLIQYGLTTVNEVAANIMNLPTGVTPGPLYPQKPLLSLKSNALLSQQIVSPREGQIHSLTLPKYNELTIVIDIETDPVHERVFITGLRFIMSVPKGISYEQVFDDWWALWKDYLANVPQTSNKSDLRKELQEKINAILPQNVYEEELQISLEEVTRFANSLEELWGSSPRENEIILKNDRIRGRIAQQTRFNYSYIYVNGDLTDSDEAELVKALIHTLFRIITICHQIEQFIVGLGRNDKPFSPTLAVYYWSIEQLEELQELLQRNFEILAVDPTIRVPFSRVIDWLAPKESEIPDPYQFRKLYDLRAFVETTRGLPFVINYTWHEIADMLYGVKSNKKFWTPHFNYMDFQTWHEYLNEKNMNQKITLYNELSRQLAHKLRTIDNLRIAFQKESRHLISWKATPVKSREMGSSRLERQFHDIASLWFIFSRLNATFQELECTNFRTTYPELSIGKLAAGRVTNLTEQVMNDDYEYTFELEGLSSNMKLTEGDYVYLVPFELRDNMGYFRNWLVVIEELTWNPVTNSFHVITQPVRNSIIDHCDENHSSAPPEWYLYPHSSDPWSRKLYNRGWKRPGLLQNFNLGISWLGRRLIYNWQLKPQEKLKIPPNLEFELPEIYMFAPEYLPKVDKPITILESPISPKPDFSQERSIITSLNATISNIQGPPGTGKSQTIAALIDEVLTRATEPVRILVTAFSYSALRVVLDKLQRSTDEHGNPTRTARIQKVFIRSESQDPHQNLPACPKSVMDLCRTRNRWILNDNISIHSRNKLETQLADSFIIIGNAHQLYNLRERTRAGHLRNINEDFCVDVIIVDEASQLPPDFFLASLEFVRNETVEFTLDSSLSKVTHIERLEQSKNLKLISDLNADNLTKVIVVGDHNQLPPVQPIKPPKKLKHVLGSLFSYYVEGHELLSTQLEINYRSHEDIVEYTSRLGFYQNLKAFPQIAKRVIKPTVSVSFSSELIREVMDPEKVVSTVIHNRNFEVAVSPLEAEIVVQLIHTYYLMMNPTTEEDQRRFWQEEIGIVAPHNAQGRLIIRKALERISNTGINVIAEPELMSLLKSTIYSVEKFQGSDRTFIIASIGISSKDQLAAEEDFIYEINRFNVLTSRAKSKVVLICSLNFLEYFPKNREIMENAAKIRDYALNYCMNEMRVETINEESNTESLVLRWK